MKFQVGDKVVIQHSNDEGEVIEIINDKMVLVDVRGVKCPAYTDQLDFPYFKRFTEKKLFPEAKKPKKYVDQLPPEKLAPGQKKERIARLTDGVWLTFLPVFENDEFGDDVVDSLKIHLVNNTEAASSTWTTRYSLSRISISTTLRLKSLMTIRSLNVSSLYSLLIKERQIIMKLP